MGGCGERPQWCSQAQLVRGGGWVWGAESESDAAPWRPGQTQEFSPRLSDPGSPSSRC